MFEYPWLYIHIERGQRQRRSLVTAIMAIKPLATVFPRIQAGPYIQAGPRI